MRDELPGMWEDADLSGGWADSETAADRPSVTDNARAEAEKAIEAIIDYSGDLPPGAPSRGARASNVVGTLIELGWAAGRAETRSGDPDYFTGYQDGVTAGIAHGRAETTTDPAQVVERAAQKAISENERLRTNLWALQEQDERAEIWREKANQYHARLAAVEALLADGPDTP